MATDDRPNQRCFLAIPSSREFVRVGDALAKGAAAAGYVTSNLEKLPFHGSPLREEVIGELARSDCVLADITNRDPNVFFELGLAQAMGKGLLTVSNFRALHDLPPGLFQSKLFIYEDDSKGLSELVTTIKSALLKFRKSPQMSPVLRGFVQGAPFFADWNRLDGREIENLCRELLTQMGFQRLEWGKLTPEIDLIAELPRKDPDGFEFRELWLISMGLPERIEMFLDMAMGDPDFFLHRVLKYSDRFERSSTRGAEATITFLVILTKEYREPGEIERMIGRLERRKRHGISGYNLRFRIWDQNYLTSLIHQFPQIGYKYFSDESRIRSKTRKSYEELYLENSDLVGRQAKLISDLEEEKNKRVRAERDAIWKEISFSAAHKIGNPIFAIETDLDPLARRIRDQRAGEALDVVGNIRASIEKAKAFVEQFKSLACAQEIKPRPIHLLPLLHDACKTLENSDITCKIDCPNDVTVLADPERLSECLDELVANAKHWLDKPEKKIELMAVSPAPEPLPSFLDSSSKYVLLHVRDNGVGVPLQNKRKIFDAFFTTYDHGTGLGLALVQRVIDGHGGGIVENGIPGQGADFEMYLPTPTGDLTKKKAVGRQKDEKRK